VVQLMTTMCVVRSIKVKVFKLLFWPGCACDTLRVSFVELVVDSKVPSFHCHTWVLVFWQRQIFVRSI
jgi:hypothetical protein